jgi:2-succinyl-5-enolpyruvyl-6-hydroxy-3-cyclohexene-1-carboxylate synthase
MTAGVHPLVELAVQACVELGVREFVVAPGSRSAPLTRALASHPAITARVVYDERAAGYIALGMAQQLRTPVGLVCTSGTAAVNFGPAVVEAFYQQVPLLVFTADRPPEWIDQQDNQAIHQPGLYTPHVRGSFTLPQDDGHPGGHPDTHWHAGRIVAEAIALASGWTPGPVHVNVPLREPLYPPPGHVPDFARPLRLARPLPAAPQLADAAWTTLLDEWQRAERKLIVAGLQPPDSTTRAALAQLSRDPTAAVFADITANLSPEGAPLVHADAVLGTRDEATLAALAPDLVVYCGGQVTSRYVKSLLRQRPPRTLWRVQPTGIAPDTYQATTSVIHMLPADFFSKLAAHARPGADSTYAETWAGLERNASAGLRQFLDTAPFGEFQAVYDVLGALPPGSHLQLGNSMPIRYANFVGPRPGHLPAAVHANRGASGIDGTVSTAVGAAIGASLISYPAGAPLTTLIVGDLGFFYDRNGLWHAHVPATLRIVVLNNHGGGIFDIIEGPNRLPTDLQTTYFLTPNPLSARRTAADHGLRYFRAADRPGLRAVLAEFFAPAAGPALLEIETDLATNTGVFADFKARNARIAL